MKAISLFSGVGGFELGFARAGIETVLQAERDPWALEVLARHWPDTERVIDVRDVGEGWATRLRERAVGGCRGSADTQQLRHGGRKGGGIGLVYGGFPCQDISVAGKRAGLSGERSGLWFEFARVVGELRPTWVVVENVAGLLSSGSPPGADLGVILDTLVELGYGVAWRTLDARYFGVPQRRRRVFIVASARGVTAASAVLAVTEGGGGDSAPGGAPGEDAAVAAPLGAHESGGYRDDLDHSTYITASAVTASAGHHGHSSPRGDGTDNLVVASTLDTNPMRHIGRSDGSDNLVMAALDTHLGDKQWLEDQSVENFGLMDRAGAGVRRLTPLECERLMGWPDGHTRWTADGREIADSHRYRMCGNGVVAPVAEWIGHRLTRVEELLS